MKYPCPTCGELKSIENSKKNKPYYHCDDCGVQVFIRGKQGIRRLEEISETNLLERFEKRGGPSEKLELIQIEADLCFLESQIEKLENKLFKSSREKRSLNDLKGKLKTLEEQYFEKLEKL